MNLCLAESMMNEWRLRMLETRSPKSGTALAVGVILSTILLAAPVDADESIPTSAGQFLAKHCLDCHAGEEPEAAVNLGVQGIDWQAAKSTAVWERVYKALVHNEMPPSDIDQPADEERQQMVQWLEGQLTKQANQNQ